jgi:hypothetical protein
MAATMAAITTRSDTGVARGPRYLRRATLVVTLFAAPSCRHAPPPPDPASPQAASAAARSELTDAVARYHDHGELDPLRAWVERNPEHDDAQIWREVIALRTYESIAIGDAHEGDDPAVAALPDPDPQALLALAIAYPSTIGGRTAQAMLEADGLRRLTEPALNPIVIEFLEGNDAWPQTAGVLMPSVDLADFRARHEAQLADRFARRLLDDGCTTTMGYCTWWVRRFPDAEATALMRDHMQQVWTKRAHPRWQGRNHAACAFACARKCRQGAVPFDDSCYDRCMVRCND